MLTRPYISFCIPAFGRLEYLRNTLNSIYTAENIKNISFDSYEVIISDNDKNASLSILKQEFNYPNFIYKITDCEGFMNSYHVLGYGNGHYLKLHNSQELFNLNALASVLNIVKSNIELKPLIFFSSGLLKLGKNYCVETFDNFMYETSYFTTWSNAFGIWKDDFDKIPKNLKLDYIFPQTSIMLTQYNKDKFLIIDKHYFSTQFVKKRSGYNKFQAFSVAYPSMIEDLYLQGIISLKTKKKILNSLLLEFLPLLYFNVKIARRESFSSDNFKRNIKQYFPKGAFWLVVLLSFVVPFKILWRKLVIKYKFRSELNEDSHYWYKRNS